MFACLILMVLWNSHVAGQAVDPPGAGKEARLDPLIELNQSFREAYARSRQKMLNQAGPVIMVEGDNLVLLSNGKRTEAKVIPEIYHTLKAVAHVPLAVYVMLAPCENAALDKEVLDRLRSYREQVLKAEASLKDRGLTEEVLRGQEQIICATLCFLGSVIDRKQVTGEELLEFTRKLGPRLLTNASQAARAELAGLDKQVRTWRAALSPDEWKKLRVIVMGSALPRRDNLATQYFSRLLGEKGEGSRIVYAESIFDESRALNLLGTHLLDTRIGTAFFSDPQRMHRDLLADAAMEQLRSMTFQP
jgi:hypothetical protein